MTYALVVSGAIVRTVGSVPKTWTRPDGSVVSGYDLRTDLHAADGWLPVVDEGVAPTALQTGTQVVTIEATRVVRTWTAIVANPVAVNRQAIEAALTAALAQIDADRAALTGAMTTANALATANIGNVAAAQVAIRNIGALLQTLLPALNRSAERQKKLIRLARGALDAAD